MIYELSFEGHTVGYFPTEAEAVRRAGYLPKGKIGRASCRERV